MVDRLVQKHELSRQLITTDRFSHWIIENRVSNTPGKTLHIYIEGDGTPWLHRDKIAADPTPHNPLALKLMVQDQTPSIYLGRPCYFGLSNSANCSPPYWTHLRYSQDVMLSMQTALEIYLQQHTYEHLTFIGYSGGGVLAMLLAQRFTNTDKLITIAANLEVDAWSQHHHYSALTGSLNPGKLPPLPSTIKQFHLAGKRDKNVPLSIIKYVSHRQPNSSVRVLETFDHICCWEDEWPRLLKQLGS